MIDARTYLRRQLQEMTRERKPVARDWRIEDLVVFLYARLDDYAMRRIVEVMVGQIKAAPLLLHGHHQNAEVRAVIVLQLLAVRYADDPEYDERWRP